MLKKFSVENYKNFKDEVILDFSDFKDYKYNQHAIKNDLIHTAIIYGKNATGKTNIGLAIFDITLHLVDEKISPKQVISNINADSDKNNSFFKYEFFIKGVTINYNYQKDIANKLTYEDLWINNKKAFSYNFKTQKRDITGLKLINAENISFDLKDMSLSVVRFIANNINVKESPIKDLVHFVDRMLWFRSVENNEYIGYKKGAEVITTSIINNGLVSKFEKFLRDLGINHKLQIATDILGQKLLISVYQNKSIPFWETASSGTKALTLFFFWKTNFEKVSFLFIDEFDAFYHTELSHKIVEELSKGSEFQTIFTTHNTSLMTNKLLRPDTYFILTEGKLKSIINCTERELREGHNLEKMYKQGEFID